MAITKDDFLEVMTNAMAPVTTALEGLDLGTNLATQFEKLREPSIGEFKKSNELFENTLRLHEYKAKLDDEFERLAITDKVKKKQLTLKFIGMPMYSLAKRMTIETGETVDDYESLFKAFQREIGIVDAKDQATDLFYKTEEQPGDNPIQFHDRLRRAARLCEFGDQEDSQILAQLLLKTSDQKFRMECRLKKFTLDKALDHAASLIAVRSSNKAIASRHQGAVKKTWQEKNPRYKKPFNKTGFQGRNQDDKQKSGNKCNKCDLIHIAKFNFRCPAYGRNCKKCNVKNHFARCCTNDKPHRSGTKKNGKRTKWTKRVDGETTEEEAESSDDSDDQLDSFVKHVFEKKRHSRHNQHN